MWTKDSAVQWRWCNSTCMHSQVHLFQTTFWGKVDVFWFPFVSSFTGDDVFVLKPGFDRVLTREHRGLTFWGFFAALASCLTCPSGLWLKGLFKGYFFLYIYFQYIHIRSSTVLHTQQWSIVYLIWLDNDTFKVNYTFTHCSADTSIT